MNESYFPVCPFSPVACSLISFLLFISWLEGLGRYFTFFLERQQLNSLTKCHSNRFRFISCWLPHKGKIQEVNINLMIHWKYEHSMHSKHSMLHSLLLEYNFPAAAGCCCWCSHSAESSFLSCPCRQKHGTKRWIILGYYTASKKERLLPRLASYLLDNTS